MKSNLKTDIQISLVFFITLLVLSGITAFPVKTEIFYLNSIKHLFSPGIIAWADKLSFFIANTPDLMFYGTDWLAFAHIIISLFFIPVYRNPVKHQANLHIGMIACLAVFPLAFICGPIRGIPFTHQLIDCSFGVIGFAVLYFINRQINRLKHENTHA